MLGPQSQTSSKAVAQPRIPANKAAIVPNSFIRVNSGFPTIQEALVAYTMPEEIDDVDFETHGRHKALRSVEFLPEDATLLTVAAPRFTAEGEKAFDPIIVDNLLTCGEGEQKVQYEATAVICHKGCDRASGHYVSWERIGPDQWRFITIQCLL